MRSLLLHRTFHRTHCNHEYPSWSLLLARTFHGTHFKQVYPSWSFLLHRTFHGNHFKQDYPSLLLLLPSRTFPGTHFKLGYINSLCILGSLTSTLFFSVLPRQRLLCNDCHFHRLNDVYCRQFAHGPPYFLLLCEEARYLIHCPRGLGTLIL